MWTNLKPNVATLEQIYKPLSEIAAEFNRPWSLAELRLNKDDLDFLRSWFGYLTPKSVENWFKTVMLSKIDSDMFISYRQMFGSILLCAGTEVCREESREDSVWPAIRSILPKSHDLRNELFLPNGQPSSLTKSIIIDATRDLNLRHAIDIEGTQQWFITIKLQFGFTFRGAKHRLAEWLVGIGRPHAIQYLNGDSDIPELASISFQSLWRVLSQYRRDLVTETEVRETLKNNPWVKINWINDLLEESKARIDSLGSGEWFINEYNISEEQVTNEELCPITNVALYWPQGENPRLEFSLDKEAIVGEVFRTDISELDFYVDGKKICRWLRQRDGSWAGDGKIYAEPEIYKTQPNLSPQVLIIQSASGDKLVEWDLTDSGLSDEVIAFDLERQRIVNTGVEQLEPSKHYAIICDCKSEIQGCEPDDFFYSQNKRKVARLSPPLNENICVIYEDFVLWQPIREFDQRLNISLTLSTSTNEMLSLNDRSSFILNGLPEDAIDVKLLIHKKSYDLEQIAEGWRTNKEITITPELAAGKRRVRVRFSHNDRTYTRQPRLVLKLLDVALPHYKEGNNEISYKILKSGDQFSRSIGTTHLKIWPPSEENNTTVFEGHYKVGKIRNHKIKLNDFTGYGGELSILNGCNNYDLNITCHDTGCIRYFTPAMLRCDAQIFLLSDKEYEERYAVYMWILGRNNKANFLKLPSDSILETSTNRVWKIRDDHNPMAVALTWKGYWLGSWWSCEAIRDYINNQNNLLERDYAILKWLRVPVLNSTIYSTLKKAILIKPSYFIKNWLYDYNLPSEISPHNNITGRNSVVRNFLWNDFPSNHSIDAFLTITDEHGNWHQQEHCVTYLQSFSEISPILLWKGLEYCLENKTENIINLLNLLARKTVGLPNNASQAQLDYRIDQHEKQVLKATAMNSDELETVVMHCIKSIKTNTNFSTNLSSGLMKLSEILSGRKYLSERIVKYWLYLSL